MAKVGRPKKRISKCKSSAVIKKSSMDMKASCPIKPSTKKTGTKRTEVPVSCKGLRGLERKRCTRKVCAQRPKEYRRDCLKRAGLRK